LVRIRRQGGFTLIELLVVLLIMGLLSSLAPSAFRSVLPGLGLKSSAREIAAAFRQARSMAIRDNRDATVNIDTEAKTYSFDEQENLHPLDSGLGIQLLSAASERTGDATGRIRFFADGTSTGGRVTLTGGKRKYHVVVDWLTGRVQLLR